MEKFKKIIKKLFLKYSFRYIPSYLMFPSLRGFDLGLIKRFYKEKNYEYIFTMPLSTPFYYMKQRPYHIANNISKYFPVFFYTGSLLNNDDNIKNFIEIKHNLFLVNDGINGNSIFEIDRKIVYVYLAIDQYWYVKNDNTSFVIYDYLDDIELSPRYSKIAQYRHEYILNRANLIVTTSTSLYNSIPNEYRLKTILITNGVEYEKFNNINFSSSNKNIITVCFYGSLAKWIDLELLNNIVTDERFCLKLIGPIEDANFEKLIFNKNVQYEGYVDYDNLPTYLKDVDVFLLPFKLNKITQAVSPVKLFEYMATSKPIVTTEMNECKKYDGIVFCNTNNVVEKLIEAYENDNNSLTQIRKAQARKNTWSEKIKIMHEEIQKRINDDNSKI